MCKKNWDTPRITNSSVQHMSAWLWTKLKKTGKQMAVGSNGCPNKI